MFVMVQMFQEMPGELERVIGVFGLYATRDAAEKACEDANRDEQTRWEALDADPNVPDRETWATTRYEVHEVWED